MPKIIKALTNLEVKNINKPGLTMVGGVSGLGLTVSESGARSWILRVKVGDKRRDIGLGNFPDVSLKDARDKAGETKLSIRRGIDPIQAKREARLSLAAHRKMSGKGRTFMKVAEEFHSKKIIPELRNEKYKLQWISLVRRHCELIADQDISSIDSKAILAVLEPIWTTKTDSATKLRGQLESIMSYAKFNDLVTFDLNPATWRNHLENSLPSPKKLQRLKGARNFASLPYQDAPEFMARLKQMPGIGARALEFAILCASRSGEVRAATWAEIDLEARLWTIPANKMKAGVEHRVPLTDRSVELLNMLPNLDADLVFPSARSGRLSDMTLTACLRRMGVGVTVHGFRSTFRVWSSEATHCSREVAETCLAHQYKSDVEKAYDRSDLLEKRREHLTNWHAFLAGQL